MLGSTRLDRIFGQARSSSSFTQKARARLGLDPFLVCVSRAFLINQLFYLSIAILIFVLLLHKKTFPNVKLFIGILISFLTLFSLAFSQITICICKSVYYLLGVNFIKVLRTNFCYECCFLQLHVHRKKTFVRKMLMKLTLEWIRFHLCSIVLETYCFCKFVTKFWFCFVAKRLEK